jgi:trehalose 6-phosphate phosphatase
VRDLDELLAPLRADPSSAAVLCDFDGTLAPIVPDPAAARPVDGATDALAALAGRYAVVAVVSGRPVSFLRALLPEAVQLFGLYGLERLVDGELRDHPDATRWRPVLQQAAEAALAELPPAALVEPKGLSLTVHYRTAPEVAEAVQAWAAERAERDGLDVRAAKMSVELHPPVAVDKGTTVRSLASGMAAACFLGDDVGDLAAFAALADLRADGVAAVNVAVRSAEAPPEVLAAADAVVDGPTGALAVLRRLAADT